MYNNVNKLLISMYDGPKQKVRFKKMIEEAKVPEDFVILRDRWHGADKDYGSNSLTELELLISAIKIAYIHLLQSILFCFN